MKKGIAILAIIFIFTGCSVYRGANISQVTTGMTKAQVSTIMGNPERILAVRSTDNGLQEVLQYRTLWDEIYALEFLNDYLVGYEFLYDDAPYVVPAPPVIIPPYGTPVFPPHRPGERPPERPGRPEQPETPGPEPPEVMPPLKPTPEPPVRPVDPEPPRQEQLPEIRPDMNSTTPATPSGTKSSKPSTRRVKKSR